jgi:hypothetical protein
MDRVGIRRQSNREERRGGEGRGEEEKGGQGEGGERREGRGGKVRCREEGRGEVGRGVERKGGERRSVSFLLFVQGIVVVDAHLLRASSSMAQDETRRCTSSPVYSCPSLALGRSCVYSTGLNRLLKKTE